MEKDKNYLYNMYNATSTGDGKGGIESYENWLERQLLSRIERLEEIEPKTITTHENQPIQDFARQVAKTVKEDWGSHNVEEFIEAFKKEVETN